MELKGVKLTEQMSKAFEIAEQESLMKGLPCLHPEHLLLGCLDDGSFPVKEAKQRSGIDIDMLKDSFQQCQERLPFETCEPLKTPICQSTKLVIEQAISYMRNYNQIFLNEGHVLKALIKTGHTENLLTKEQSNTLLNLAAVSRDMLLDLACYSPEHKPYRNIKRVSQDDVERLILFINDEFGSRWTVPIQKELMKQLPSIFIALDGAGQIIGFAAFDVYKPGYFGPMGVAKNKRAEGIGQSLLHVCLEVMHQKGYEKIVIDQAGPLEFYEKTCNAKVIPLNK